MKKLLVVIALSVICMGCASSQMSLKRIDHDIPSALVTRYSKDTTSSYVDKGETWSLPILFFCDGHVARTDKGFQAYKGGSFGLGLILGAREHAAFDPKGRLMSYRAKGYLLAGLLLTERDRHIRVDDVLYEGHGWSTLWGAFGYRRKPSGAKRISFLWIPIPISRGELGFPENDPYF